MPEQNAVPGKLEVEQQLERMLANEVFSTRSQQAKVFAYMVRGALAGEEITEKYIREKVFPSPPYKPESNVVRRTIDLLRKLVPAYYADQGKDDSVIIKIPHSRSESKTRLRPGQAYTPVFKYNRHHAATREVKLGEYYMRTVGSRDAEPIYDHFQKALSLQPEHVGALLGLTETFCGASRRIDIGEEERDQWLYAAKEMLDRASRAAPKFWRTHAARGWYLLCKNKIRRARREFNVALSLDRMSTQKYRGYIDFLTVVGQLEEAANLAKTFVDDEPDAPMSHAFYGFALIDAGRFTEAEEALRQALDMDPNLCLAHMGMALIHKKWSDDPEALNHITRLRALLDDDTYENVMIWLKMQLQEQ